MKKNEHPLLKICFEKLKYYNYSKHTISIYTHYINRFLDEIQKPYQHLNAKDIKTYLESFHYSSNSQQNQVINAIRFLYREVLNKKYDKVSFKRPRSEKKLPQIIDSKYLKSKIESITNIKHKAIISLAYSASLRVSEVINLKIEDIDSKRMIIYIKNGKGRKDRIVPLSDTVLKTLRDYFAEYRPDTYLFNGQNLLKYSSVSCNAIVKKYLGEKYHFHQLRHSGATTMLENGTDLRIIQSILGHKSSHTTEIYTHVSVNTLKNVTLPI